LGEQLLRNYSCFESAVTSVSPAATSAALHFSAAADSAGDGRAPNADVVACAEPVVAKCVSATAAPAAAGCGINNVSSITSVLRPTVAKQ